MSTVQGKEIVVGVTGCIAAYKSAELVRLLIKQGAQVRVVMTDSAREFVTPLTFQTLSGNPVTTELFSLYEEKEIGHISLARRADMLVIAPATANCIGKIAGGIADDMLSTVVMATTAPVLIAPAMNVHMWENPILQENIARLRKRGYRFVEPGQGELACGDYGTGRLAETDVILDEIASVLLPHDFLEKNVIVTAGPTREFIDPVRFISNPSSGKMGFALARALCQRGARVTLISGPTALSPPARADYVTVTSAREMLSAVERSFDHADIVIKSAAVADYRPREVSAHKVKKKDIQTGVELEPTTDILAAIGQKKGKQLLIGFAAETRDLVANARQKLQKKNLDMIIVNDVGRHDSGFGTDMNTATFVFPDGNEEALPTMSKDQLAHRILDSIVHLKAPQEKGQKA